MSPEPPILMIRIIDSSDRRRLAALLDRRPRRDAAIERRVARIVDRVRRGGDRALLAYARTLDGLDGDLEVTRAEMEAQAATVGRETRAAIRMAARHIRHVARLQVPRTWSTSPVKGVTIDQRVLPLDRVGCYVP